MLEIHQFPCLSDNYGFLVHDPASKETTCIDTPDADKLLANQYADVEAMARYIGADSLAFLSIDGLYRAVGGEDRNAARPQFTDHYFTGEYPTRLLDKNGEANGGRLSVMASHG